jgi:hypothetical protein
VRDPPDPPLLLSNELFFIQMMQDDDVPSVYFRVVEPMYSARYELVYMYNMLLYLQSAVVMMDSLILLSITSHTHKHNNNTVNITTIQDVWFAQA